MRLAHLSDPHVIDWSEARWQDFLGKRLTGGLNFSLNRRRVHRIEVLEALVSDLAEHAPDHVAVTGDMSSLAFPKELETFGKMLERAGFGGDEVSVVPGNHDAYTRHAWVKGRTLSGLGRFATNDARGGMPAYPFVRLRGPIALIGLDSAIARPWFVASGLVGPAQTRALASLLRSKPVADRFPVVLVHHPPIGYGRWTKEVQSGLMDRHQFLAALDEGLEGRDALVLSGHWHERLRVRLDLPGRVELLVAPSASHLGGGPRRVGAYSLVDFVVEPDGATTLGPIRSRGFDPDRGEVVELPGP